MSAQQALNQAKADHARDVEKARERARKYADRAENDALRANRALQDGDKEEAKKYIQKATDSRDRAARYKKKYDELKAAKIDPRKAAKIQRELNEAQGRVAELERERPFTSQNPFPSLAGMPRPASGPSPARSSKPAASPGSAVANTKAQTDSPTGLTAGDRRWADALPDDLKRQTYAIPPAKVDAMKLNGSWARYQKYIMEDLNQRTGTAEKQMFAKEYSAELDKNSAIGCAVPVLGRGACALSGAKALTEKRYFDAAGSALSAAPVGKTARPILGRSAAAIRPAAPRPRGNPFGTLNQTKDISNRISKGHAFDKHVLARGEFQGEYIRTRSQFADHIKSTIQNHTYTGQLRNGRSWYYNEGTNTVVIYNPRAPDKGTAFKIDRNKFPNPFDYLRSLR